MDILVDTDSASEASDKIKDILFAKSAEKINAIKPNIANTLFDQGLDSEEPEEEDDTTLAQDPVDLDAESQQQAEVEAELEKAADRISGEDRVEPES